MSIIERILKFVSNSKTDIAHSKEKRGNANLIAYEKMKKNKLVNTVRNVK